jgi:GNAT superfamily N-acetyltransferase
MRHSESSQQEADMAATGGNETMGREVGQTSGPLPVKQMIDGSARWLLDRRLEDVAPMLRAEPPGVVVMGKTDSRHHAARGVICRLEGIEPADWRLFFSHLAVSDIRYRFGRLVSVEAGLRLVTLPNRYGSAIFCAFCPEGLVGVANLAKDDRGRAEIAILIRSDWKRRGIGAALMRAALCQATQERLQVYGFIEPSNAAIIGLMRRFGFVHGARQIDRAIMHWRPAEPQGRSGNGGTWGSREQSGARALVPGQRALANGDGPGAAAFLPCNGYQPAAALVQRGAGEAGGHRPGNCGVSGQALSFAADPGHDAPLDRTGSRAAASAGS